MGLEVGWVRTSERCILAASVVSSVVWSVVAGCEETSEVDVTISHFGSFGLFSVLLTRLAIDDVLSILRMPRLGLTLSSLATPTVANPSVPPDDDAKSMGAPATS